MTAVKKKILSFRYAEEDFWKDIVQASSMEYSIEYAVEAADKAVLALRERKAVPLEWTEMTQVASSSDIVAIQEKMDEHSKDT